ncbi:M48 family metalloprotease [Candidatus Woesearchaeota archaeon]|nr:M48 family metalloprotease [Candidatus Woesearchaeota archaeon]
MACNDCLFAFFYEPSKVWLAGISLVLSVVFFLLLRRQGTSQKAKILLVYLHIFTLLFPFVYYAFNSTCAISSAFFLCRDVQQIMMIIMVTMISSVIIGYLLVPKMLELSSRSREANGHWLRDFVDSTSGKFGLREPKLHIVDTAKPIAYSIYTLRPHIYISIGMAELLTRKEIEAVVLHEFGHIKNRTSFLKFSALLHRIMSPFSYFTSFRIELGAEEIMADRFAINSQGTDRHIKSAKRKIGAFDRMAMS